MIDQRDAMHKRGWTYFKVAGEIAGQRAVGHGRIPFVYSASDKHWPWLNLKVGGQTVSHRTFAGLSRPWMGLHSIDSVRRDAARRGIWFEAELLEDESKAKVMLTSGRGKLAYTIDMEKDVVEKIDFLSETGDSLGQLEFTYMQEMGNISGKFAEPTSRSRRQTSLGGRGIKWLFDLIGEE